jgi:predicted RNase H-like HicB family nuclease
MQIVAIIHRSATAYGVSFPDLPGCIAAAGTEQDALSQAAEAVAFHLQSLAEHGDVIPVPRSLDQVRADPACRDDFEDHVAVALVPYLPPGRSLRVNVTLDEHLLAAIDRAASSIGATRSGFLAEAARAKLQTG